jgi:hypothetical protein
VRGARHCAVMPPSATRPCPVLKAGIVRGEKDDALGDVGHRSHAANRQPRQRLLPCRVEVAGAEIARPHRQHLVAHVGLGRSGVNRVDQCQIDYTRVSR